MRLELLKQLHSNGLTCSNSGSSSSGSGGSSSGGSGAVPHKYTHVVIEVLFGRGHCPGPPRIGLLDLAQRPGRQTGMALRCAFPPRFRPFPPDHRGAPWR